jgi:hypothetical protein
MNRFNAYEVRQQAKKIISRALIVGYHPQIASDPRPARMRSNMPDYVRDYFESYGLNHAIKGSGALTNEHISIHDAAVAAMASPHLTPDARGLLWALAAGLPWKKIMCQVDYMGTPLRTLERRYAQSLMLFAQAYAVEGAHLMRRAA